MLRRFLPILLLILVSASPLSAAARRRSVRSVGPEEPIEHVFMIILENADAAVADQLPFLNRLASQGARLTNYYGITHPSQPNYIAFASGSTWGVNTDNTLTLNVRHLGDLLEHVHRNWRVYAENYPGNCYLESATPDFLYVRRHVPFLEFSNVVTDPVRCSYRVVDASVLDADIASRSLPTFSLYIPNQRNNGHDTSPATADAWLEARFGPLLRDSRFTKHTLFIVTYDESEGFDFRVSTVLWGAGVHQGATSARLYDHYSLLRTIEELFNTGTLNQEDAKARPIDDVLTVPKH